ncbi:hypothetical protein WP50_01315, partial [Lactiplantibacillus plantarum]
WTNDANAIAQMKTAGDYIYQGEADSNRDTQVLMVKLANGVKQYGSHQPDWYGPGVRFTGMTNSLTNYRIKTRIHHIKHSGTHNGRSMGRVEVLLLDPNGATIGRFGLADSAGGGTPTCYLQITKPGGTFAGGDGKHVQSDPRATLPQVETPLKNGLNTITVDGTARTEPVIQVVPKRDLKHIGFTLNGGEYGLGPDSDEDQAVAVQPYTQVVNSDVLNTMAEWTNDANAIAQMKTAGDYIYQGEADSNRDTQVLMVKLANGVKQYGSHQPDWYGPGVYSQMMGY